MGGTNGSRKPVRSQAGIGQLSKRRDYAHGRMYIRTMDYDTTVTGAPQHDPFVDMHAALGTQGRALASRSYQTITGIIEIGSPPKTLAVVRWSVGPEGEVTRQA
jgi:hypothetical protein